ncbi:MAG TPA: alpha-amylase family glycosyl hydrolase [Solirubrobacteraceae bacterium]|nr:alpha-amylase family glycosyl hydrolase [Solirubrobacteraceae bacterium]
MAERPAGPASRPDAHPWERPLGARPLRDGLTEFRVWAPSAGDLQLVVGGREIPLKDAGFGVREALTSASPGDDYLYVVDGHPHPDPCSRWQPEGLRGPSRIVSPAPPQDGFTPPALSALVIYELHVGTFSERGTFDGVIEHLEELAALGVSAIELMPVAEFPGERGWGYDGVYAFAAQSSYGGPEGLRRLVAAAHAAGLAVILDVVHNHVGASGVAAMEAFGPYFAAEHATPWGRAMNFDGPDCDPVREWACQSAEMWVREYGIDGLRLDAVHAIVDSSPEHIVAAIARRVHEARPGALVIAESARNDPIVARPVSVGGWGCDAVWADDFHHALRAVLTEDRDGPLCDFGRIGQLAKAFHSPHVLDGGYSAYRRRRFGARATDLGPERFVVYSQNHDQVGNRARGERIPAAARPLAALCTLLSPYVPLLFMGEEYGELAPFQFFFDHIDPDVAHAAREGRRRELEARARAASEARRASRAASGGGVPEAPAGVALPGAGLPKAPADVAMALLDLHGEPPDPGDPATFARSRLTRRRDAGLERLYRELLAIRRRLPPGEPRRIEHNERARWLVVARGEFELACNFGTGPVVVPCKGSRIEIQAGGAAQLRRGSLTLEAMAGALTC